MTVLIAPSLVGTPWDRENRQRGSVSKGLGTLAFTFLVITILIAVHLFFVSSRLWVIRLGYSISEALKEQRELTEVNQKLKIERATLISPGWIARNAKQKLKMREPEKNQIRFVP